MTEALEFHEGNFDESPHDISHSWQAYFTPQLLIKHQMPWADSTTGRFSLRKALERWRNFGAPFNTIDTRTHL
ncbi:hypothetical protein [Pseudomonas jessenii]|uniref:hypothetical protein n=1 Tax=Pseudomonas jessenii TaxID=77298 RepID=UPI0011B6B15A|nr:hypothetical protein [Pseudomonas jessenii]